MKGTSSLFFCSLTRFSRDYSKAGLIYEIYPQSADPQLELIARLDPASFTHDVVFYSLSADRLIFVLGSVLKIWDYKLNAWASWSVEHEDYDQVS